MGERGFRLSELLGGGERELGELLDAMGRGGFGALIAALALPAALPLPAAGYAAPFGIGILILGSELALGLERPTLPRWLLRVRLPRVPRGTRAFRLLASVETLFRRRRPDPTGALRIPAGAAVCAMGVLMMIPVPGTNTLPAAAALLTGLGVLYRDGLWSSLGIASGLGLLGLYGAAFWGALRLFRLFP